MIEKRLIAEELKHLVVSRKGGATKGEQTE
jgi:hypothetical protein